MPSTRSDSTFSRSIFGFILRHSRREQFTLLLLTGLSFPFLYYSLDLPKTIINKAIGGKDFPREYWGVVIDQIPLLLILCGIYLALVFINGGFKYYIHVFQGILGERMLRRLRYQLIERVIRFPLPHFRRISQGEVVAMVNAETEPLGGFIGDAFALPAFQGGTLVTIIVFMFLQDWIMGLAAVSLYPVQAYLIPRLQRRVNQLGKERVRNVRKLSERIGELISGAHEVHANDTSRFELADFSERFGYTFDLRADIYRKKFMIKFLNNFLAQLTPFFFFSIGGYLVIVGDLTFGALVAVLAAYKDMTAPWKELLQYYQQKEDARIKYEQLVEQFEPAGMYDPALLAGIEDATRIAGTLVASNLTWEEDEGVKVVNGVSFAVTLPAHIGLRGPAGSGKSELARLIARQLFPSSGRIEVGGRNLADIPESVTGRRIAYAGQESYIASGTVRDALVYGLQHRPLREATASPRSPTKQRKWRDESIRAGNSADDHHADWIDYEAAGATGPDDLVDRIVEILRVVDLEEDIFRIGLRRTVDPAIDPPFAEAILAARRMLRQRLDERGLARLVEPFDRTRYNAHASVAENILFGTPVGPTFAVENLGENVYVLSLLDAAGLTEDFVAMGLRLAEMMVDIFRDLPPGHEFFERFSFISSDDLPEFQALLRRAEGAGPAGLAPADRSRLIALPFRLVPARHHLGLIDEAMQGRLMEIRRAFMANLPADLRGAVQFFDAGVYNAASSIQDNILFGKLASDRVQAASQVGAGVAEVIDALGLRRRVIAAGLDYEVGIGAARLATVQRQKLVLARGLLRRPDLTIVNEALSALDTTGRATLLRGLRHHLGDRSLLWVDTDIEDSQSFDHLLTMERGRLTATDGEARRATAPREAAPTAGPGQEAEILSAIPLFAGLDRSKLRFLAFTSERLTYDAGQVIFRQGEPGDRAYVILEGEAEVLLETPEGTKPIAVVQKHGVFGELALLADIVRTATVRASAPITALAISKSLFVRLAEEDASISSTLTRVIVRKLEGTLQEYVKSNTMYDPDTGLPSYRLFADRFQQAAARRGRKEGPSTFVRIDLRPLAERAGLTGGELRRRLVLELGRRLRRATRLMDTVTFVQDMEMAMIVSGTGDVGEQGKIMRRIAELLAEPVRDDGIDIRLGRHFEFAYVGVGDGGLDETLALCRSGKARTVVVDV